MAKVSPVLWKHKSNNKGEHPIYIRISSGEETRYLSLREYVPKGKWNEREECVRKPHQREAELNQLIQKALSAGKDEIYRLKIEGRPISASHLKTCIKQAVISNGTKREPEEDYFAYADMVVEQFEREGKIYTHKRYKSCVKKFRAYAGEPLPFEELTPQLLRDYQTHLIEHYGNKQTTVAANFNAIRAILYRAMRDGYAPQESNPFFHFQVKQGKARRAKLSVDQLQAIEFLDLEKESLIWHVRNYFLFSVYCAGVRFGDIAKLKRKHVSGGRLEYRMSKTGQNKSILLLPEARRILGHYESQEDGGGLEAWLFPILDGYDIETPRDMVNAVSSQNALVNKYLKEIAERAGIGVKLSFHIARHTFADLARKQGWDVYDISKALGHSSLKVTEKYLKGFDMSQLDDKMKSLFT